jgi:hypothetical protein
MEKVTKKTGNEERILNARKENGVVLSDHADSIRL